MTQTKKEYAEQDAMKHFTKLTPPEKIEILYVALDLMQQYNGRTASQCILLALGFELDYTDEGERIYVKCE